MKMKFKLGNLIQFAVIPSILVSVSAISWMVYNHLREVIIVGFDKKLSAVSSVTASFIDARDHERLLAPRIIDALTVHPADGVIYGVDTSFGETTLVKINPKTGGAVEITKLYRQVAGLTSLPKPNLALGIAGGSLVEVNLVTGAITDRFSLPPQSRTLAAEASGKVVYVGGAGLHRVDLSSRETKLIADLRVDELALVSTGFAYVFDRVEAKLRKINLRSGEADEPHSIAEPIRALELSQFGQLLAAADRLIRIDPTTLMPGDEELVHGFRSEESELFHRYVGPMRKIKTGHDLTYLYTQTLSDSGEVHFEGARRKRADQRNVDRIVYVLDSNTDEDHSPIGEADTQGSINERIRDVYFKGLLYLSDVEFWDEWGLIKSGFAPIVADGGEIVGMAGADVEVAVIHDKTKIALVKVSITSVMALVLASIASLIVSRRLTGPIERMKDVSLKIAAGQYGEQIEADKLHELSRLSGTFNLMSRTLKDTVSGLKATNEHWEADRREYELIRYLTLRNADLDAYGAWVEVVTGGAAHSCPTGWTNHDRYVLGWLQTAENRSEDDLRFRAGTAALVQQLLKVHGGDWASLRLELSELFEESVSAFFFLDLESSLAHFAMWGDCILWSPAESISVADADVIPLEPGVQYVISSDASLSNDLTKWSEKIEGDLVSTFKVELGQSGASRSGVGVKLKKREGEPA